MSWKRQRTVGSQKNQTTTNVVSEDDIAVIVSDWTGIPVKRLAEEESERLMKMEDILTKG